MTIKKLKPHLCNDCKIDGVIICTATESSGKGCNKAALTLEEARERKQDRDLTWEKYQDAKRKTSLLRLRR